MGPEWGFLCQDLVEIHGNCKTLEFLCDSIILLCHVVNSQDGKNEEFSSMLSGLKYCLQNFGIVAKVTNVSTKKL